MHNSDSIIHISSIILLLVFSALFSGAETGITAASRVRIFQLEKKGKTAARLVAKLKNKKEETIAAILLGNNLANIFASVLATSFAIKHWGEASLLIVTIVMTFTVLLFAELLPKTFALKNAVRVSLFLAPFLYYIIALLSPIANAARRFNDFILKILRLDKLIDDYGGANAELMSTIELHHQQGAMRKHDRYMLGSILEMGDINVEVAMTHRKNVKMINANSTSEEIIKAASHSSHTRMPVWKDKKENIIGILNVKDLFRLMHEEGDDLTVDVILMSTVAPWFIPSTASLKVQLLAFRQKRQHFSIVVDEYGEMLGIITLEDIIEEIVGDIDDEHDEISSGEIRKIAEGKYSISGETKIRDINRDLDIDLPDEDATTIAGLLMYESRQIPNKGAVFEFFNYRFMVTDKEKNQLTKIMLQITKPKHQTSMAKGKIGAN